MSITSVDPKAKRLKEFQDWFDGFTSVVRAIQSKSVHLSHTNPGNFSFAKDAADKVNAFYWEWMDKFVRPMVKAGNGDPETNIDRYKICSLTELVIVTLQPIECENDNRTRDLNARLAFQCALSVISNWDCVDYKKIYGYVNTKVIENHLAWLRNYDPENPTTPPIFSNAVTWQLIHENYLLRVKLELADDQVKKPAK